MTEDQGIAELPPMTVDDLANLLESVHLSAEVRIAILGPVIRQLSVIGIREGFVIHPTPPASDQINPVWIVAGEDLGEVPLDLPPIDPPGTP
jgi:hypothetical protein